MEPPCKKAKMSTTETPDNDLDLLQIMAKAVNSKEKTGPKISTQLSEVVTQYLECGMDKEVSENLMNSTFKPENCDRLKVVRVNAAIFNNVSKDAKQNDLAIQKAQRPLIAGITKTVSLLNSYLTNKGENQLINQDMMKSLPDIIGLLCESSHEIDLRKHWIFKSEMKEQYKALCSDANPVTGELFGDQLSTTVKDLNETNKVTSNITRHSRHICSSTSKSGKMQNHFLFKGQGYRNPYNMYKSYQRKTQYNNRGNSRSGKS